MGHRLCERYRRRMYRPLLNLDPSQFITVYLDREILMCCQKKRSKLTATEAMRELDVERAFRPVAESQRSIASWNGVPGLEAAISVHVEAEETAIADGSRVVDIE